MKLDKLKGHTPGPWKADFEDMNLYSQVGSYIATIGRRVKIFGVDDLEKSGPSIETKANAELMASAPDLLKANAELIAALEQALKEHKQILSGTTNLSDSLKNLFESLISKHKAQ